MLKTLRDVLVPALILCSTGASAAWTLSAFSTPMPVFQAQAVVIVGSAAK